MTGAKLIKVDASPRMKFTVEIDISDCEDHIEAICKDLTKIHWAFTDDLVRIIKNQN